LVARLLMGFFELMVFAGATIGGNIVNSIF
jgi:hypothetical protein